MRELRFVGPGGDGEHFVVETLDGDEQFRVQVDPELDEQFRLLVDPERGVGSAGQQATPSQVPEITLSPREIQTRVRAGADPAEVAAEVGVAVERILLFATPVLEERSRITGEARRARARRSTTEGQLVQFGEAVDGRYTAHGIDPTAVSWDSYRRDDGVWVISATWRGGDSDRTAQWAFTLATRTVTPLDETATDLLSDRPIRPVVRAVPDPPAGGRGNDTDDASSQDAESQTAPLPAITDLPDDQLFDQQGDPVDHDAPPLPLRLAGPANNAPPRAAESEEQKAARARIPSWDDIMLGVRRKRD